MKSLNQKKHRFESGLFLAEGVKIITELIESSFVVKKIFCTHSFSEECQRLLELRGKSTEIVTVSDKELAKISLLQTAQRALALVQSPMFISAHIPYPTLVLDDVQDPGNMGTLIRVADWFGIKAIVASPDTVDWQNPKVIQATMGSFLRVPIYVMPLEEFFERNQYKVYGAVLNGSSIYEESYARERVILLGNESRGLRQSLERFVDNRITIPSYGSAESLNVAVAAAVICAEMRRQDAEH